MTRTFIDCTQTAPHPQRLLRMLDRQWKDEAIDRMREQCEIAAELAREQNERAPA